MLQQTCTLLQSYCSTHLFYFIAHETMSFVQFIMVAYNLGCMFELDEIFHTNIHLFKK